ncbi:MAG: proline dehydrogenase family protein [Chitinophagales bacterium]|nr:proline dehydrogenase family protein [Chitinophagales bacterium]MDW8418038.1 proline dehydrogenase family protein [Chitinophagales bacterium]
METVRSIPTRIFEDTETAFAHLSDADLYRAKWLFTLVGNPSLVQAGSALANTALRLRLPVSFLFRLTVYNHFCGGETLPDCRKVIDMLAGRHVGVMLNYGVELKETEEDFEASVSENLRAIKFAGENETVKTVCIKLTGLGPFVLFEKMNNGETLTRQELRELSQVKKRFHRLCKEAAAAQVSLYVDAEESWIQNALDNIVEEFMREYNRTFAVVCNTFQLYRHDRLAYLQQQITEARQGRYLLGAKLVRGAYMEKERERAEALGYPSPIHADKKAVDRDFDKAVLMCLENLEVVNVCIASHSEASNLYAMKKMDEMNLPRHHPHVWFSQLYGMGDHITFNQARLGFNATKYLPYGPVRDVIPYLIRRAQENTSVAGQTGRELSLIQKEIARRKKH